MLRQLNPQPTDYAANQKLGNEKSPIEAKSAHVESSAANDEKSSQAQSDDPSVKYMYTILPNVEDEIKVGDMCYLVILIWYFMLIFDVSM